ncbi:MAG: Smr/MutS family protein [Syntrophobacteraceae bacterium]
MDEDEIVRIPIEDFIDLHTFRPNEVKDLLHDYLEAAEEKGFKEVRIIHGKGTGALRKTVHSVLTNHPRVVSFKEAGHGAGGWGATIAVLRGKQPDRQ